MIDVIRASHYLAQNGMPVSRPDEDLVIELLEQADVLVHPGHFYDFHSDGYLVVSLIAPEAEFAEGVRRLLGFVASL